MEILLGIKKRVFTMRNLTKMIFTIILFSTYPIKSKGKGDLFCYDDFKVGLANSQNIDVFINNVKIKNYDNFSTYNNIQKINVDKYLLKDGKGGLYLGGIGEFIRPYWSETDSCLAMTYYLRKRFSLKRDIYDFLLRKCISLDYENYRALFLLAKLRYEGGYVEDAYLLIHYLRSKILNNKSLNRIWVHLQTQFREVPNLDKFDIVPLFDIQRNYYD